MSVLEVVERVWHAEPYPVGQPWNIGGHVVLFGYGLSESTGNTKAELDLFDGADATGLLALPITLTPGQSTSDWLGPQGLHFRVGLFGRITVGTLAGSLWIADRP